MLNTINAKKRSTRRTRRRRRAWLVTALVLALCVIAGTGALGLAYYGADETAVAYPAVTAGGAPLAADGCTWYTPVVKGLFYKPYAEAIDRAETVFGTFETKELTVCVPKGTSGELNVTDAAGAMAAQAGWRDDANGFCVTDAAGAQAFAGGGAVTVAVPKGGAYTLRVTVSVPRLEGFSQQGYGTCTYAGGFLVTLPPVIRFSADAVPQGGVLAVQVENVPEGVTPVLEEPIGNTVFARQAADGAWVAAVGVGYKVVPGAYPVTVHCGALAETHVLTVQPTEFTKQYMTIDAGVADATVNSAAAGKQWRDAIYPLYDTADPNVYWQGAFAPPLDKMRINTEYALYRYTNGSPNAERHGGVDLDGETGDTVYATAAGRVAFAGFLTMTGNTVVLEHGGGLKSYYFHMDSLACTQDAMVARGAQIGAVGTTGYSTGAHLHFEVKLGRQSVNPLSLIDGTSNLFFKQ